MYLPTSATAPEPLLFLGRQIDIRLVDELQQAIGRNAGPVGDDAELAVAFSSEAVAKDVGGIALHAASDRRSRAMLFMSSR